MLGRVDFVDFGGCVVVGRKNSRFLVPINKGLGGSGGLEVHGTNR